MALAGGAALAGLSPAAAAQSGGPTTKPDFGGWLEGVDGGFRDARGEDSVTVRVGDSGNGGTFAYRPANLWIDPGTTVTFEWISDNHNVVVEGAPDGAGWSGHEPIENTGFSFETTFETGGLFQYYCNPHRSAGMLGGVAVGDGVPTTQVQTGTSYSLPSDPGVPFLAAAFAVTGGAAALVLGAEGMAEIGRRGGVRGEVPEGGEATEAEPAEPETTIGHDEYDPWGTVSLLIVYLAIIAVMWVVMYFVEFLGGGPTVIG
jgi:halocyanin-like protein